MINPCKCIVLYIPDVYDMIFSFTWELYTQHMQHIGVDLLENTKVPLQSEFVQIAQASAEK